MMLIKTSVRPSAIHGLGVFALESVPSGTPVWRFQAGFDHEFSPEQSAALPAPAREHVRWYSFIRKTDGHAILSGDHACFMNHSPAPNTGAPPEALPPPTTVALRAIAAGEELTCDYFAFDADAGRKLGLVASAVFVEPSAPPALAGPGLEAAG
jgi:hypothetical protein